MNEIYDRSMINEEMRVFPSRAEDYRDNQHFLRRRRRLLPSVCCLAIE
jgi:hypothetical protein